MTSFSIYRRDGLVNECNSNKTNKLSIFGTFVSMTCPIAQPWDQLKSQKYPKNYEVLSSNTTFLVHPHCSKVEWRVTRYATKIARRNI